MSTVYVNRNATPLAIERIENMLVRERERNPDWRGDPLTLELRSDETRINADPSREVIGRQLINRAHVIIDKARNGPHYSDHYEIEC